MYVPGLHVSQTVTEALHVGPQQVTAVSDSSTVLVTHIDWAPLCCRRRGAGGADSRDPSRCGGACPGAPSFPADSRSAPGARRPKGARRTQASTASGSGQGAGGGAQDTGRASIARRIRWQSARCAQVGPACGSGQNSCRRALDAGGTSIMRRIPLQSTSHRALSISAPSLDSRSWL